MNTTRAMFTSSTALLGRYAVPATRCLIRRTHKSYITCLPAQRLASHASHTPPYGVAVAPYSTGRSAADTIAEELQGLYSEAKDEFEIAVESSEAKATYAAEDREAAREYLEKLVQRWRIVVDEGGEVADDLTKRPIGQRIRELSNAVEELNKKDFED